MSLISFVSPTRFDLSFRSAIVKIYPFANLCWVNKDENYSLTNFPSPSQPKGQYISHKY